MGEVLLTDRQIDVLRRIHELTGELGRPPRSREVKDSFGWVSAGAPAFHTKLLVLAGLVTNDRDGRERPLVVTPLGLARLGVETPKPPDASPRGTHRALAVLADRWLEGASIRDLAADYALERPQVEDALREVLVVAPEVRGG